MSWFDAPTTQYPRRWSEQSLDYRLFFIWEFSLMAAMFLGSGGLFEKIPAPMFYGGIAAGALVVISLSIANRRRRNWHWPGITTADILKAIGGGVLMALFFYVSFRYLPRNRSSVPMILFALSIAAVNILTMLKLVQPSEIDFQGHCYDPLAGPPIAPPAASAKPVEPQWKRIVRGVCGAVFLAVWLEGMAFFYVHENYVHNGARHPTATQTKTINEHGAIIYLTPDQKRIDSLMLLGMATGIPAVMLGGLFVHFILGVKLFPNRQTPRGIFDPKDTVEYCDRDSVATEHPRDDEAYDQPDHGCDDSHMDHDADQLHDDEDHKRHDQRDNDFQSSHGFSQPVSLQNAAIRQKFPISKNV